MKIPGYKIERLIGKGGSASVYLAVQESLGREVALKVMKKFDDRKQADRFAHEGRIIASLNHRNIITIHDVGTIGDRPFIAMEYLKGQSLKERIDEGIALPKALSLLEQLAGCLHFVHRRGIIHRDIKPSNILFHADGTPKLTDFGIAKLLDSDQELTLDGSTLGSPYYLSPEQAEGLPLDGRSDIYALGIVFYQMLTGQKPYAKNSAVETIVAHLTQPLPVLPEPFADYQDLLEAMIAKRPEDRVGSAKELIYHVREAKTLSSSHAAAPVPSPASRPSWAGRPESTLIGWAFAGLLASVMVYAAVSWFSPGDAMPQQAQREGDVTPMSTTDLSPHAVEAGQPVAILAETRSAAAGSVPATQPTPQIDAAEVAGRKSIDSSADSSARQAHGAAQVAVTDSSAVVTDGDSVAIAAPAPSVPAEPGDLNTPVTPAPEPDAAPSAAPSAEPEDAAGMTAATAGELSQDPVDERAGSGPEARGGSDAALVMTSGVTSSEAPETAANPEQDPDPQIEAWLEAAESALAGLRLTRPADDNALAYYHKILARDPAHAGARAGIQGIADSYAGMARRAIARNADRRARRYVRRGLDVQPGDSELTALTAQLDQRERARRLAEATTRPAAQPAAPDQPSGAHDSIRGEGTGNMIEDFKGVWRAVFN